MADEKTTLGVVPTGARPAAAAGQADGEKITFYEAVGGRETFAKLVHVFYQASRTTRFCARCTPKKTWARRRSVC